MDNCKCCGALCDGLVGLCPECLKDALSEQVEAHRSFPQFGYVFGDKEARQAQLELKLDWMDNAKFDAMAYALVS